MSLLVSFIGVGFLTPLVYRSFSPDPGIPVALAILVPLWLALLFAAYRLAPFMPVFLRRWLRPFAVIDHGSKHYVHELARRWRARRAEAPAR